MSSDATEKRPVRISIYNQEFTLRVSGEAAAAELQEAANHVDELMTAIARSGNMESTRVAILACLHLQDRVRTLQRELAEIESRFDARARRLAGLLDEALPE